MRFISLVANGCVGMSLLITSAAYCQTVVVPRVELSTKADLLQPLGGDPDVERSGLRFALLAAQGRSLVPRLHAIVMDESEDGGVRANALQVLALVLDSSSVRIVLELARGGSPLSEWARAALQLFPYEEACGYWRSALRDPSLHHSAVAAYALSGIRFCGDERDIALVEAYVRRGVTRGTRERAEFAIASLRLPKARRYETTDFAGNYPPTGEYSPPAALAARIRRKLCGEMCALGVTVTAGAAAALTGY